MEDDSAIAYLQGGDESSEEEEGEVDSEVEFPRRQRYCAIAQFGE